MALPILMYHDIGAKDRYASCRPEFEKQVRYLRDRGFTSVLPEHLELGNGMPAKGVMLTFDDGYETDRTIALPLLKEYGFSGVSFITTGFVGKSGYLTWRRIKELREEGFSIQSHTHTHPLLSNIGREQVRQELRTSKRMLEDKIGAAVTGIALPGGAFSPRVIEAVQEEGYRAVFTSKPGTNERYGAAPRVFCRMLISGKTSLGRFGRIIGLDSRTYAASLAGYYLKYLVKRAIGFQRYHTLWHRYYK